MLTTHMKYILELCGLYFVKIIDDQWKDENMRL
jgi:hypothetical protein